MSDAIVESIAQRKPGRPRKADAVRRRTQVGLRVTVELKRKLEDAIAKNGRSLAQESELRIERTFRDDEVLAELRAIRAILEGGR